MKLLYIGGVISGGNGFDWCRTFEGELGVEVYAFDTKKYFLKANRVEHAIERKFGIGRNVRRLNKDILDYAAKIKYDIAIVSKGVWLYKETVKNLKFLSRKKYIIHLTIDAMFLDYRSELFVGSVPDYSVFFTDKKFELNNYYAAGAEAVYTFIQPYGSRFENKDSITSCLEEVDRSDVCFIGHCQKHYVEIAKSVSELQVDLKIWGPGWEKMAKKERWLRQHVMGSGRWGWHYPATLASSKIGLGLLSKRIPEEATTRSVEIPASGSLLLAERTEQHMEMFLEGVEVDLFSDSEELKSKITKYLNDDDLRTAIANSGEKRVRNDYRMSKTVEYILTVVESRV